MRAPIVALTPDIPDDFLLTGAEVATILNVSRSKAYELLTRATIPGAMRIGNQLRIKAAYLRAYFRQSELPTNPQTLEFRRALRAHRRVS